MRGHIRRRSDNSWTVVIDIGRDPETKKRRQKWVTVHGTKREAEKVLAEMLVNQGNYSVEAEKMTVEMYLKHWLEAIKSTIRESTHVHYKNAVDAFIPHIGQITLSKLNPMHIQEALGEILEDLSPGTAREYLAKIKSAFNQAVKWDILGKNPAAGIKLPKYEAPEKDVWTETEVKQFLQEAGKYRYYPVFWLALYTGMRIGEILALRWTDIDLEKRIIYVRRTVSGKGYQPPKNKRKRKIPVDQDTVELLKKYRKRQMEECLRFGRKWTPDMLVFTTQKDKPVTYKVCRTSFQYAVNKAMEKHNIKPISGLHQLRHTHATILLRQGVNPKIVAERLGHSSVKITLDTYSHVLPDTQEEAVQALQNALRQQKG